jgi:outer membrane protein assembly factor BamB
MTAKASFRAWRTASRVMAAAAALCAFAPAASRAAGCNWPMYGHDPGHSFAQSFACAQINAANVTTLTEKWSFSTGASPVTASTTVVNGIAYVGDFGGTLHAIDVATGTQVWSYLVDDQHTNYPAKIVSSVAIDTMRVGAASIQVLVLGGGATLYVLDPTPPCIGQPGCTGVVLARQDLDPRSPQVADSQEIDIESSPVIAHLQGGTDRIMVGMDVHNDANVGRTGLHSFALVENPSGPTPYSLQLVYKFDPETRLVRHSLSDGSGTGRGCGGIWSSPVFDPAALSGAGLVAFGTSNCEHPAGGSGEAESEGVYAINATTGALAWEFHPRGYNNVDDDFGSSTNLLPGGLVGEGSKDGFYYAFDRETGTPASAWLGPDATGGTSDDGRSHPAQSGHLSDQFALGGILGTPAVGTVNGEAAIFIASAVSTEIGDPGPPPVPDPTLSEDPQRMLSLHAISAVDGRILWRAQAAHPAFGAPTYANGVVFVPSTFDFSLVAVDANTGLTLAQRPLPGPPSSAPTAIGDTVYGGIGTSTGEGSPLAPLSGVYAFNAVGP